MIGAVLFYRGEAAAAHTHLAQGSALYVPVYHRTWVAHHGFDLGAAVRSFVALSLWRLGAPEQALTQMHESCILIQELPQPIA
jgi:hypothetical protein